MIPREVGQTQHSLLIFSKQAKSLQRRKQNNARPIFEPEIVSQIFVRKRPLGQLPEHIEMSHRRRQQLRRMGTAKQLENDRWIETRLLHRFTAFWLRSSDSDHALDHRAM